MLASVYRYNFFQFYMRKYFMKIYSLSFLVSMYSYSGLTDRCFRNFVCLVFFETILTASRRVVRTSRRVMKTANVYTKLLDV